MLTYGLGFQPGELFKVKPSDTETWLACGGTSNGETFAVLADSQIGKQLLLAYTAGTVGLMPVSLQQEVKLASKSFWPDELADSVIQ